MSSVPPQGSAIRVDTLDNYQHISVPHGSGGVLRYFVGVFFLLWMVGWYMGFSFVLSLIQSGVGGVFPILWLLFWSIGGLGVVYMIYRVFRKSRPEQLLLKRESLSLDTGVPPLKIGFGAYSRKEYRKSLSHKRRHIKFTLSELKTMELRETDSGNRLTIDKGAERVEIAGGATEIEREWLFNYLQRNYS